MMCERDVLLSYSFEKMTSLCPPLKEQRTNCFSADPDGICVGVGVNISVDMTISYVQDIS